MAVGSGGLVLIVGVVQEALTSTAAAAAAAALGVELSTDGCTFRPATTSNYSIRTVRRIR